MIYTVSDVFERELEGWGLSVTKWVAVPKPVAQLELDEPAEHTDADGNVVTHFKTRFGVRFARVVEPTGFVLWLQEVQQ